MRHETRDPLKCIEREWMHKAWVLDTTRLWWLSKLLCPHLQVLMPHVSSPHPNTGETDQTKIKPMQIKQVADSFGMMNGLAENRLLTMDVTRRHLKQSVHRLFFFFFFSKDPSVIWGGDLFSFWLRSRCFCMRGTFEHGLFNWTHPNHIWRLPGGAKASGGNYVCLPFRRLLTPPH